MCILDILIENLVRYYNQDDAVSLDTELQSWADELALNASATPDLGQGKVGYPYPINDILIDPA